MDIPIIAAARGVYAPLGGSDKLVIGSHVLYIIIHLKRIPRDFICPVFPGAAAATCTRTRLPFHRSRSPSHFPWSLIHGLNPFDLVTRSPKHPRCSVKRRRGFCNRGPCVQELQTTITRRILHIPSKKRRHKEKINFYNIRMG